MRTKHRLAETFNDEIEDLIDASCFGELTYHKLVALVRRGYDLGYKDAKQSSVGSVSYDEV